MNQCSSPFAGLALPAGSGSFPELGFKHPRMASALLAPVDITATRLALFKTGIVSVIREGGGLGLSIMGITIFLSSCWPG